tara:strand:- start:985 stop:1953 length:969 start_codon:yes stop_codon:yes gene_type:complete
MTIKYIALSGGGPSSCISYSVMKELEKKGFWNLCNIKSFYGCSSGVFLSILLSLGYNWDWMDDFMLKRPWCEVSEINSETIINYIDCAGIIDYQWTKKMLSPLLEGKGLESDVTMKDFYNFTQKKLYIYVTNVKSEFEKIVITHENYPDLPLYKALHMTMTIPGILVPICDNDKIYVDGGFLNHFPIVDLVESINNKDIQNEEVLGINLLSNYTIPTQNNRVRLPEIITNMIMTMINNYNDRRTLFKDTLKYTIRPKVTGFNTLSDWYDCMKFEEKRQKMMEVGSETATQFLSEIEKRKEKEEDIPSQGKIAEKSTKQYLQG